jgi:hypothetical protein
MALTVLVNARPWLSSTSAVCGDIENVIATLVPALRQRASVSCSSWLLPARFPSTTAAWSSRRGVWIKRCFRPDTPG